MTKSKFFNLVIDVVTTLILFLFIISFSVVFTLNFKPLYYMDVELLNIDEKSGISKEEIKENYDVLIDYNSMFSDEELKFPTLAMSESGKIHFEEVKVIFVFFQKVALVGFVVGALLCFWHLKKKDYRFLKMTGITSILIPLVLGMAIAINWDWAFVAFHKIAFNNDFWIFDARTDPVITILPDTFFLHCAAAILGLIVLQSVACIMIYRKMVKKTKNV